VLLHTNENNVDSDVTAYCTYDNIQNDRRHPGCPLKIVEKAKKLICRDCKTQFIPGPDVLAIAVTNIVCPFCESVDFETEAAHD
jgi:Zn finger protein HypA/HybF involved in hydrogenase expression